MQLEHRVGYSWSQLVIAQLQLRQVAASTYVHVHSQEHLRVPENAVCCCWLQTILHFIQGTVELEGLDNPNLLNYIGSKDRQRLSKSSTNYTSVLPQLMNSRTWQVPLSLLA